MHMIIKVSCLRSMDINVIYVCKSLISFMNKEDEQSGICDSVVVYCVDMRDVQSG